MISVRVLLIWGKLPISVENAPPKMSENILGRRNKNEVTSRDKGVLTSVAFLFTCDIVLWDQSTVT